MEGNTVGIGQKLGVHLVSKVAEATVGAAERRADIQLEWHISRKDELHLQLPQFDLRDCI